MSTSVPHHSCRVFVLVLGLFLPRVIVNLSAGGPMQEAITNPTVEQQLSGPDPHTSTESSGREPPRSLPYQMVAHSDYNNRLLAHPQTISPSNQKKDQNASPYTSTPYGETAVVPTRKRSTGDVTRRTRFSPGPSGVNDDLNRSPLAPGRYYDSYGDWHHDGEDVGHWHSPPNWPSYPHKHVGSGWTSSHGQHLHHQPQGNGLLGVLDGTGLYQHDHHPPFYHHQHGGLLSLQLLVMLHPVLLLGTVSFLVCLINAVLGLVDKVKLPLVRSELIAPGSSTGSAGLRDGRDEHFLGQLYQFLNTALEQQQQRNETFALGRP